MLNRGTLINYKSRQVADIPPPMPLEYTEHLSETKKCSCGRVHSAEFPKGINAPVQYGERVRSYLTYFSAYQLLPQKRSVQMLKDLFDIKMSEGTLNNILEQAYNNLETTEIFIKKAIQKSSVMHLDETGMYVNGKRIWEHSCSTQSFTYYFCHENRGSKAIKAGKMLTNYFGRIVHDGWQAYFDFVCLHALCNAHHLRELVFIKDHYKQKWADSMITLLCKIKHTVDQAKIANRNQLAIQTMAKYQKQYKNLIAAGYRTNPAPLPKERKPGQRGRLKQHPARNLLNRLDKYQNEVLAFSSDFEIPFDNNLAERDLRMTKVKQKISGCFRSVKGAQYFCRIRGYISTVQKQGYNVYEYLNKVFQNEKNYILLPE
jgi:transposase